MSIHKIAFYRESPGWSRNVATRPAMLGDRTYRAVDVDQSLVELARGARPRRSAMLAFAKSRRRHRHSFSISTAVNTTAEAPMQSVSSAALNGSVLNDRSERGDVDRRHLQGQGEQHCPEQRTVALRQCTADFELPVTSTRRR